MHVTVKTSLHQHNVQQDSLHGIESAVSAEILVVDDAKVDCKEDCKAAMDNLNVSNGLASIRGVFKVPQTIISLLKH